MTSNNLSENIEEYLEVLYREGSNKEQVSTTTLSNELKIAPASVTQMLKKLESLGYINYVPYKGAILTDKGMSIAQKITRKHRIIEKFLTDILNIKPENVHSQACEMEHSLSDEAERALCFLLEYPALCPDNNNIPACDFDFNCCRDCQNEEDFDNVVSRKNNLLSLSELKTNLTGKISFIRGNDKILKDANELGMNIGCVITFNVNNQDEGTVSILIDNKDIKIPLEIANNIFIEIE